MAICILFVSLPSLLKVKSVLVAESSYSAEYVFQVPTNRRRECTVYTIYFRKKEKKTVGGRSMGVDASEDLLDATFSNTWEICQTVSSIAFKPAPRRVDDGRE